MINQLKRKLKEGDVAVGSFVYIPSSRLTEIVGMAGFDFVVIDMEHGPIDIVHAEDMVRAADVAGVTPLVRVSHNTRHLVMQALDIGAHGLHVPDINTADEARTVVSSSKYGPVGRRGLAGVRALQYGLKGPIADHTDQANQETMIIAHIEDIEAIRNLDELLEVEGIDVYYLGPVDLSNSLGIPGQVGDPKVKQLVEEAISRIAAAGKTAGCISVDSQAARRFIDLGARYIATHALKFMTNGSRQFIEEVTA